MPRTWSALPTEECASSLMATTGRSARVRPIRNGVGVPADHQAGEVAGRPAGHEAPARSLGQPGQVGQHPQGLVLGGHRPRGLDPRRPLEGRAGDDHVEEEGGLGRGGRDERQEFRAVDRHGSRGQRLVEELHHRGRVGPPGADDAVEGGGQRLVDRAAVVERHRVEGEPPPAVVEDEVGQLLVVEEHGIAHGGPFCSCGPSMIADRAPPARRRQTGRRWTETA